MQNIQNIPIGAAPPGMEMGSNMNQNSFTAGNPGLLLPVAQQQQQQQQQFSSQTPVIEIATYADTDVYECYIRGAESRIVMRKIKDDWINITQVFKIARFSKNQRTKILEKESNDIEHEKVQGGYGRFQGTWIPLQNAKELVDKYQINDIVVQTIINFKLDPNNPPLRRAKNSVLRKASQGGAIIHSPSSYNKHTPRKKLQVDGFSTAKKSHRKSQSLRGAATSSHSFSSQPNPSPLHNVIYQTPQQSRFSSHSFTSGIPYDHTTISAMDIPNSDVQASGNSTISRISPEATPIATGYSASQKPLQFYPVPTNISHAMVPQDIPQQQQPYHQMRLYTPQMGLYRINEVEPNKTRDINGADEVIGDTYVDDTPNKAKGKQPMKRKLKASGPTPLAVIPEAPSNDTQIQQFKQFSQPTPPATATATTLPSEQYRDLILQTLSSDANYSDNSYSLPPELYSLPPNFDVNFLVDEQGHTPLHWAAAMGNIPLVKCLLSVNANALICNTYGFNCLTKALFYNNNFDNGTFQELISILKICLITPDQNRRLPLHYLVELTVNKSKDPAVIGSYMETILGSLNADGYGLLKTCLDFQDNAGNTPLHLAALNLNIPLFNKLCSLNASTNILNYDKHSPLDILSNVDLLIKTNPSTGTASEQMTGINVPKQGGNEEQGQEREQEQEQVLQHLPADALFMKGLNGLPLDRYVPTPLIFKKQVQNSEPVIHDPLESMINMDGLVGPNVPTNSVLNMPETSTLTGEADSSTRSTSNNNNNNSSNVASDKNPLNPSVFLSPSFIPSLLSPTIPRDTSSVSRVVDDNTPSKSKDTVASKPKSEHLDIQARATTATTDTATAFTASIDENARHFASLTQRQRDKIADVKQSPTVETLEEPSHNTKILAKKLNDFIDSLTWKIDTEVKGLVKDERQYRTKLARLDEQSKSLDRQINDICNGVNVPNIEGLRELIEWCKKDLLTRESTLAVRLGRSQRVNLRSNIWKSKQSGRDYDGNDINNADCSAEARLRDAIMLSMWQARRVRKVRELGKAKSNAFSTVKVRKYRQLIGMAFDTIDTKLDQIEKNLQEEMV